MLCFAFRQPYFLQNPVVYAVRAAHGRSSFFFKKCLPRRKTSPEQSASAPGTFSDRSGRLRRSRDRRGRGACTLSHPARGAWIEIVRPRPSARVPWSRPHRVRGLKFDHRAGLLFPNLRAPRRTPPTADAPDCKCSPGRSYKRKACSAERTRSEARGHRRATGEEVP